jgi:hypothetical protein
MSDSALSARETRHCSLAPQSRHSYNIAFLNDLWTQFTVEHLSFVICHLSFVICYLLFVICHCAEAKRVAGADK